MALLPRFLRDPDIGRHLLRDEGEVIVDEVRKHWVVYVVPALIALAGLLSLALFVVASVDSPGCRCSLASACSCGRAGAPSRRISTAS